MKSSLFRELILRPQGIGENSYMHNSGHIGQTGLLRVDTISVDGLGFELFSSGSQKMFVIGEL